MKRYRLMGFGLLAAAGMQQCQPACTPEPPAPVETTTTTAAAPEITTTTTQPEVTTTTAATTTTTAPNLNPLNIRWNGYACDEYQTMSGWSSMLAVEIVHDGPADAPGVQVVFENQDGTLGVDDMANMNPGASTGLAWVGWPRVSTVYPSIEFHTFRDSTRVSVRYQGQEILGRTFTLDDVRRETPACIPVIDTPGVPG